MCIRDRPVRWLAAISRYRATISGGPNFAFDLCARKVTPEQAAPLDLGTWSHAFNAAEPVRADTLERFTRAFAPRGFRAEAWHPLYGLAEATLMTTGERGGGTPPRVLTVAGAPLDTGQVVPRPEGSADTRRLVGLGQPGPELRVAIVAPDTRVRLAPDRVGEIWVSGPSVAQGYWNPTETSDPTFHAEVASGEAPGGEGGWLRTGDLGFLREGELFFTGRLKDLVIIRGRNHAPQDLELTVEQSHAALRPGCGAAFALDTGGAERLVVVQELHRDHMHEDLDALARTARRAVAEAHGVHLDTLVLVRAGSIPKTSSGKIQRHACRQDFLDGRLDVLRAVTLAAPQGERPPLATDEALARAIAELGLDSMQQLELRQLLSLIHI